MHPQQTFIAELNLHNFISYHWNTMAQPTVIFVYVCLCIASVTKANPITGGRKITFSTATSIDYSKIKFNEKEVPTGTPEYYESHKWIAVNNEGMEFAGTLEEVMLAMETESKEDDGDDTGAVEPHPTSTSMKQEDIPGEKPRSNFNTLKQAITEVHKNVEKRSVIGSDDRLKKNPNLFPYTAIGQVEIGCTGTFIAPRTVLTSGHCVHEGSGGQWYTNINIKRGKDCDPDQGTTHTWHWAVTFYGWTQHSYMSYDIAIITVYQPSPSTMLFTSRQIKTSDTINIAGYPGDKAGQCLWGSSCKPSYVDDSFIDYPCDTAGGMSGSGVYRSCGSTRYIHGVHGYGGYSFNTAIRITQFYEDRLRCWINYYDGY